VHAVLLYTRQDCRAHGVAVAASATCSMGTISDRGHGGQRRIQCKRAADAINALRTADAETFRERILAVSKSFFMSTGSSRASSSWWDETRHSVHAMLLYDDGTAMRMG